MSKKPVNFYRGAKGTFRIEIISHTVGEDVTIYKATHTHKEIKQAIEDGFVPYCVMKSNTGVDYFYLISESDILNHTLLFDGNIEQVTILDKDEVAVVEKESGGSGGIAFHAYFFDDNRYVCDETGTRVQFDSIVNLDPVEIPIFIMRLGLGANFYCFYLVSMENDRVRILSADGSNPSTSVINKEEGTGYAKMGGLT